MHDSSMVIPQTVIDAGYEGWLAIFHNEALGIYNSLIEKGVPKQDARMILPLGTETDLVMTANAREWLLIFSQRITPAAQWEIKELCTKMRDILIKNWPNIIGEYNG